MHDNGVGMTEDEIAFAMQPFHQLDTAPRKQTGTGLGLPVTKALVDANRARLVIASEPGVGTSADVIFPQSDCSARAVSADAAGGRMTFLARANTTFPAITIARLSSR